MRKFEFKKSYEEIEIGNRIYRVDFSDNGLRKHQKDFEKFYTKSQELAKVNSSNMSQESQEELLASIKNLASKFIENLLGPNTFEELYDESGKSMMNMLDLIMYLADIVNERSGKLREENMNKYLEKLNNREQ